jgi:hypothetical protein
MLVCFCDMLRFVDDLTAVLNPFLPHLLHRSTLYLNTLPGIYSAPLQLECTGASTPLAPAVPYMSFTIAAHTTTISQHHACVLTPYDKRDHPPFSRLPITLVRYVHFASCIPLHTKRNIVVNGLLTMARFSTTFPTFMEHGRRFLAVLQDRGFPLDFLTTAVTCFLVRYQPIFPMIPGAWRRLIHGGDDTGGRQDGGGLLAPQRR